MAGCRLLNKGYLGGSNDDQVLASKEEAGCDEIGNPVMNFSGCSIYEELPNLCYAEFADDYFRPSSLSFCYLTCHGRKEVSGLVDYAVLPRILSSVLTRMSNHDKGDLCGKRLDT